MFKFLKVAQWKTKPQAMSPHQVNTNSFKFTPNNNLGNLVWQGAIPKKSMSQPDYSEYTVKQGDNLTQIAKNTNSNLDELLSYNSIKNANIINVGQKIKIPTKKGIEQNNSDANNSPLFANQPGQRMNWQDSVNTLPSAKVINAYENKTGKRPYIVSNIDKGELYVINPAKQDTIFRAPFLAGTGNNNKYYGNSSSSLKNDDRYPENNFERNNNLTGEGVYELGKTNLQHAGSAYGKFTVPLRDQRGKEPGLLFHQATSPDRLVKLNTIKKLQAEGKPIPPDLVCGSNGCMNVHPETMDSLSTIFKNNFVGVNSYVLPRESNKNSAIKMKDGFPTLERIGNNFTNTSDTTKAPIDMNTFNRKGPKIDITRKTGFQPVQAGINANNNLSEKDKNTDTFFKGMNAASDSLQVHYGLANDEMAKLKGTTAGIANAETKMGTDYGRYGGLIDKKDAYEKKGLMGTLGITNQTLATGKQIVGKLKDYAQNRGLGGILSDVWDAGTSLVSNVVNKGEFNINDSNLDKTFKQIGQEVAKNPAIPSQGITQMKFMPKNERAINYLKNQFNITKTEDGYDPYKAGAMSLAAVAENYTNLKSNRKNAITKFNDKIPLSSQNNKGWNRLVRREDYTRNDFDYLPYTWQNPIELNKGTATPKQNAYVKKVKDYQKNNIDFKDRW